MNRLISASIALIVMLAASPAMAAMTYVYGGSQIAAKTTATTTAYNDVRQAYANFSKNSGIMTETFEGFGKLVNKKITALPIADAKTGIGFGTIYSDKKTGYIGSATTNQAQFHETPLPGSKYYFSNGRPKKDQPKGSFTLALDKSYRALGFFASDLNDIGGSKSTLDISGTDGSGATWTQTINLRAMLGALTSGSLVYFSVFSDLAFDTVTFNTTNGDGYGIDNLSVGAPTPIPGAIWLLGSSLVGLVGLRRRFV